MSKHILVALLLASAPAAAGELPTGDFDIGIYLRINGDPEPALQSAPLLGGSSFVVELGPQLVTRAKATNHAMIEVDGMFPDDPRCLLSYQDLCVIRGHKLTIE